MNQGKVVEVIARRIAAADSSQQYYADDPTEFEYHRGEKDAAWMIARLLGIEEHVGDYMEKHYGGNE